MNYLENLENDYLKQNGFSKVLLVRKESIHLKHILTYVVTFKINFQKYLDNYTNLMRMVYNIDRKYEVCPSLILKVKKDCFEQYYNLVITLNPILYLDKNINYHFLKNIIDKYNINVHVIDTTVLKEINNPFSFVISNNKECLNKLWLLGFKTYYVKNKRIKNFSLYK